MRTNDSDLFFTCSLIELIGRMTCQKRSATVELLGRKIVSHIYANAGILHCEPIAKTAEKFIELTKIPQGVFDNVSLCKYDVPSYWTIGKVYSRLIEDVEDGDIIDALFKVYTSPISDDISNYNSDFFYQPRDFIKEQFLNWLNLNSKKTEKKPAVRFRGFTDSWEQRKLGETAISFDYGLNASAKEYDGNNKYIRITDIDDATHTFLENDLTSPDTDLNHAERFKLQEHDIVFARTGASVGKTYLYDKQDGTLYYAGFLIRMRIKPEYDSEFVFQTTLTKPYCRYIAITSQRSGQPGVNANEYSLFELSLPKEIEEQKQIGSFFRGIDHLITLHQRE